MQFSHITLLASLSVIALGHPSRLARRAEGINLVNCGSSYSAVVYCQNEASCSSVPTSGNLCQLPADDGNNFKFEGVESSCTFSTGVTFGWLIESGGASAAYEAEVGNGYNGYNNYEIFRDDNRVLYTDSDGNQCKSYYYASDGGDGIA